MLKTQHNNGGPDSQSDGKDQHVCDPSVKQNVYEWKNAHISLGQRRQRRASKIIDKTVLCLYITHRQSLGFARGVAS